MSTPFSARLGAVLRKRRLELRISQRGLGRRTGHQRTHLGQIESGLRNPTLELAQDLAQALGWTLSELMLEAERTSNE